MRVSVWLGALLVGVLAQAPAGAAEGEKKPAEGFSMTVVLDVPYVKGEGAHERHKLDLYLPQDRSSTPFPVFFFIHGGGWRNGSKDGFFRHGTAFARHGIGLVACNYRLSPAAKHPDHIKDVARAFAWTVHNIAKYGGNPNQIFVSGHSAGGHLAALLASDESYLTAEKLSLANIKGAVPISGVFRIGDRLQGVFGEEETRKQASPLTHVRAKLPPMLILYGDQELRGLGKQAEEFGEALKKAGADATVQMIKDRNHGTVMGFIARPNDPAAKLIFEFLAKHAPPGKKT